VRAVSNTTVIAYVPQTVATALPPTPAWQRIRATGEELNVLRETIASAELDPSRSVTDLLVAKGEASGSLNFEFSDATLEAFMAMVMRTNWTSDALINANIDLPAAFEIMFNTKGGATETDTYKRLLGCRINTMSLEMQPGQIITGSMGVIGQQSIYDNAMVAGSTYTAPTTSPVMSAVDFSAFALTGMTNTCLANLKIDISNNLRANHCLGDSNPTDVLPGQFEVKGSVQFYLDHSMFPTLQQFIQRTDVAFSFTLGNTTLKKTRFDMPRTAWKNAKIVASGNNQDIMVDMEFQALKEVPTLAGGTMKITRNVV
jgi:Phage tail tube protein